MEKIDRIKGILGVSHIALVVPDIDTAWMQFVLLGFDEHECGTVVAEEFETKVKVIFNGTLTLELISPIGDAENSPLVELLKQKCYCIHHIGYFVDSIDAVLPEMKKNRFTPISTQKKSPVWGKNTLLLANRKMGVIELLEK